MACFTAKEFTQQHNPPSKQSFASTLKTTCHQKEVFMELMKILTQKQLDETLQKNKYNLKIDDIEPTKHLSAKKDKCPLLHSTTYTINLNEIDLLTITQKSLERFTVPQLDELKIALYKYADKVLYKVYDSIKKINGKKKVLINKSANYGQYQYCTTNQQKQPTKEQIEHDMNFLKIIRDMEFLEKRKV